jgi:hypothetical protein
MSKTAIEILLILSLIPVHLSFSTPRSKVNVDSNPVILPQFCNSFPQLVRSMPKAIDMF